MVIRESRGPPVQSARTKSSCIQSGLEFIKQNFGTDRKWTTHINGGVL